VNSKIIVFGVSALGILLAFFMGRAAGQGQLMQIALVFGVMVGAPLLLSLGKNYWYLIPISILSELPALPFGGRNIELAELSIALCFGIFVTRVAFKLDRLVLWRATHIPIYLFMAWVLFIFCLYPVGLAVFGASTMGARFYAQLVLSFMAFLVVASRDITEKDCKWIIIFVLVSSLIAAVYRISSYLLFGPGDEILNPGSDTEGFYTWHQSLSGPAMAFTFILFAWKKPRDIFGFRNPWLLMLYLAAIAITLYSGKRTAIVALFLAPIVSAVVFRQYAYLFVGAVLGAAFSLVVVFGHGTLFSFPLQFQRTLSWLPAKWDSEFRYMERGGDPFRESLRRFARENIKRYPIVGRGFAIEYSEIIGQLSATRYVGGGDSQAAPYAIGRAWHNTWLGYAADFGIPLSVIQALLYMTVLVVSFKASRAYAPGSLQSIVSIYICIYTVRDVFFSHVVGHSALDAWYRWWMYGLLFCLYASKPKNKNTKFGASNNHSGKTPENVG
jgi:hypothetical protein